MDYVPEYADLVPIQTKGLTCKAGSGAKLSWLVNRSHIIGLCQQLRLRIKLPKGEVGRDARLRDIFHY